MESLGTIHGVAVVGSSNVYVSYSTLATCATSALGIFGHHAWCCGRGVVQRICELFHTHHMQQKLVWRFWRIHGVTVVGSSSVYVSYSTLTTCATSSLGEFGHRSWCYGRGVVQCICELLRIHHMHQKLVWKFWTPFMVLQLRGRPMYM